MRAFQSMCAVTARARLSSDRWGAISTSPSEVKSAST